MRPQTHVTYELNLINIEGEEISEVFSHNFDSEIYDSDIEGTDVMMVNFKVGDLKEKHGDVFLLDFSVERGGILQ
jgi:hypothetical protein